MCKTDYGGGGGGLRIVLRLRGKGKERWWTGSVSVTVQRPFIAKSIV